MELLEVPVEKLAFGMFISKLDRPWTETPFAFQDFVLQKDKQLEVLRKYCKHVFVDPEKAVVQDVAKVTAEDIVATCLAKLYLAWPRIESRGNVDAYARRTLVNETNSLWRRAWKRHEVIREHLPEQPIHHEHHSGDHEALWAFVNTLPTKQRSVVVLRYYEQLSEAEVAEVMGISIGTVKSQCSRALHTLRAGIHTRPELLPQQREPR